MRTTALCVKRPLRERLSQRPFQHNGIPDYTNKACSSKINRRLGQPGNRQLMPGLAERALRIIRERYADFGPTLTCEKLAEIHGLYLAKETVRKLRPPRVHQPRLRRDCTGELIQIEGCEHR